MKRNRVPDLKIRHGVAVRRTTISQANAQAENTASSDLATLQGADNFVTDLGKPASDVSQATTDLLSRRLEDEPPPPAIACRHPTAAQAMK